MMAKGEQNFHSPTGLDQALLCLESLGNGSQLLAGATWIMRSEARDEKVDGAFVSLSEIPGIRDIHIEDATVSIGAMATQEMVAKALAAHPSFAALTIAAGQSANPSIRRVATIGGNICTTGFAASDIVPALLALDADVETYSRDGSNILPLAEFLSARQNPNTASLVTRIHLKRLTQASTHVRVTLRKAGDYPVANISAAIAVDSTGIIRAAKVAVGSVEPVARRWTGLENALIGNSVDDIKIREIAEAHTNKFTGRDGPGVPGWYRVRQLPALAAKAFASLSKSIHEE